MNSESVIVCHCKPIDGHPPGVHLHRAPVVSPFPTELTNQINIHQWGNYNRLDWIGLDWRSERRTEKAKRTDSKWIDINGVCVTSDIRIKEFRWHPRNTSDLLCHRTWITPEILETRNTKIYSNPTKFKERKNQVNNRSIDQPTENRPAILTE